MTNSLQCDHKTGELQDFVEAISNSGPYSGPLLKSRQFIMNVATFHHGNLDYSP